MHHECSSCWYWCWNRTYNGTARRHHCTMYMCGLAVPSRTIPYHVVVQIHLQLLVGHDPRALDGWIHQQHDLMWDRTCGPLVRPVTQGLPTPTQCIEWHRTCYSGWALAYHMHMRFQSYGSWIVTITPPRMPGVMIYTMAAIYTSGACWDHVTLFALAAALCVREVSTGPA